jgi:ribulose-bisphosphate carboxylase large chain
MKFDINIIQKERDYQDYFYVTYDVASTVSIYDAAWNIALGQSVGNPTARSEWETPELFDNFCAKILFQENLHTVQQGTVVIGYPLALIDWATDGIAQLLCVMQGGQTDIASVPRCRVIDLEFDPAFVQRTFLRPKYGNRGFRSFTNTYNKPFFGGIIKPKTGITPDTLLDMTKALVEGGVNFIKEDEIMSNPSVAPLEQRVEVISKYLQGKPVVYCYCINSDPAHLMHRAQFVADNGGNGVHVNFWSGFGSYKSIREMDLPLYMHYQRSGVETITHPANPYGINWTVMCKLAAFCGVDTIHAGMWGGGYMAMSTEELHSVMNILHDNDVVPALSCGMKASLVQPIVDEFGVDWMANVGGSIHSDPEGTYVGTQKMRAACDAVVVK